MYDGNEKNFGCRNIDEELAKKFWTPFVEILLRNKRNCKILHFFLPNLGGRSKWKSLNVKILSWVHHNLFLSTLRSLVSIEKNLSTFGSEAQTETRQKKISWNFWQNFFILHDLQCALYFMKCCYIVTECCLWCKQQMLTILVCCK